MAALLIATCGTGPAPADEPGVDAPAERVVVDGLLEQLRGDGAAQALEGLVTQEHLDPWLVAERLRLRVGRGVAERYAGLLGEAGLELAAYVRQAPELAFDGTVDLVEAEVERCIEAGDWTDGRAAADVGTKRLPLTSVGGVRFALLRAFCLQETATVVESVAAWIEAADAARALGWLAQAREALISAFQLAQPAGYWLGARDADMRLLEVQDAQHDLLGRADTQFELGQVFAYMGDPSRALDHLSQAIDAFENLGRTDDALDARSVRTWVAASAGHLRRALDEQADLARALQEKPDLAADNRIALATIYWMLGDVTRGVEALGTPPAGGDAAGNVSRGVALGTQALLEGERGRPDLALPLYQEAHDLFVRAGELSQALVARANVAEAWLQIALAARSEAADLKGEAADAARSRAQKALEDARTQLEHVVSAYEAGSGYEAGAGSTPLLAAQETLGRVLLALGDAAAAKALLLHVAREAERMGAWRSAVQARAALAGLLHDARSWKDALGQVTEGLGVLDKVEGGLSRSVPAGRAGQPADLYEVGFAAAADDGDLEAGHQFLERGRAAALLRALGGRSAVAHAAAKPELVAAWESARSRKNRLSREHADARGTPAAKALWEDYKAARREEEDHLGRLEDSGARAAGSLIDPRRPSLTELSKRLKAMPQGEAPPWFVSFSLQGDRLLAMVVGPPGARLVRYEDDAARAIRTSLRTVVEQLSVPKPRGRAGREFVRVPAGAMATLGRLLVEPLGLPAGRLKVHVCPDRELAFVPFALVFGPDVEVALEPSATTWDRLLDQAHSRGRGVLALGDPDYSGVADPGVLETRGGPRLGPLEHTRKECQAVASDGAVDRLLLGADATESGFVEALGQQVGKNGRLRSVHLACHGLVDVEWPTLSCLAITPGQGEDGFLTGIEVLRLPIQADLVSLSACQTGRGRFVRGEGVMSLARAFMQAGAPRVLVSLWDVDDAATAFLMERFYGHWRAGKMGAAQALRLAQKDTREHQFERSVEAQDGTTAPKKGAWWQDPEYWAAWVLWGLAD